MLYEMGELGECKLLAKDSTEAQLPLLAERQRIRTLTEEHA